MNLETLTETLDLLENSRIAELEIESGDGANYLKIRRTPKPKAASGIAPIQTQDEKTTEISTIREVTANLVGRFYAADEPVEAGRVVEEDEIIGTIESMRLMNPVTSPVNGVILAVRIEDGQPVEYGQLLFEIIPD